MKKISAVFWLLLFFMMLPTEFSAVSETDGGIFYSIENEEVTVEGFNYAGNVMDIPDTIEGFPVKYIAAQACRGNEAIVELRIPASVVSVGEFAFAECRNLVKVKFESGTVQIGFSAFRDSASLRTVTLPDTLVSIDDCAFYGCIMLGKLSIPQSVSNIGVDVFSGCSELRLDVKNNKIAAEYAERYSIPTDFSSSWTYTVLLLLLVTALLSGAFFAVDKLVVKKKKQRKETQN